MDAGEALGDHGADAEVQRREGGVLAAGALPVVVPADDGPGPISLAFLWYSGSKRRKVNLAISGTFDRNDMTSPRQARVTGRDVVIHHYGDRGLERVRKLGGLGRRLDVRAARDLDARSLILRRGLEDLSVIHRRVRRGLGQLGYSPSSRGSVMTPRRAVAAAVVGLVR